MKHILPILPVLILSACVSRNDPEKPAEELPTSAQPRAQFASSNIVASERQGAATVTVSFSAPTPSGATLTLTTAGTATAADYALPAMPIPVPVGVTSMSFDVQVLDDGQAESIETLALTIAESFNLEPASSGATATLSIVDDLPVARFASAQGVAAESDGTYEIEILLSSPAPAAGAITMTPSGSVNPSADLSAFSTQVPFAAGADRVVVTLNVVDDGVPEPTETLGLTISSANGLGISPTQNQHTVSIVASRPTVRFTIDRSFSVEDSVRNDIRLSTTTPAPYAFPLSITATGTATPGVDVNYASSLTFPAGATSVTLPISILDDGVLEGAEQLAVTVSSGPEATIDSAHAVHSLFILADARLNDTGVTGFASDTSNAAPTEPASAPGQDGSFGSDKAAGGPSFDFIKLDEDGNPLPKSAPDWTCVRDNTTGKIWESKYQFTTTPQLDVDGEPVPIIDSRQMRSYNFRFTWYNPDATSNGGSAGSQNINKDSENATPTTFNCSFPSAYPDGPSNRDYDAYCNTEVYVKENNAFAHCGRINWRMPTLAELQGIANFNPAYDAISNAEFDKYTLSDPTLSSTTVPGAPATVYCFDPVTRTTKQCLKNSPGFVRLVSDLLDAP